ncbi:Fe(3+)-hydroxamate ABC transporter permease FhuB [Fodinicurvata sediminis]|uniref:Fe(3+)-hydroxamate ABC transporter permease FhuB n=1 Tax=Fodinicurvata sediminis TaxID=1121832 RepID=UPI0003B649F1|nr:Fe(3+)-hydroxamate ABC transporter permease FhuB [Fodinicurvata sediminis]
MKAEESGRSLLFVLMLAVLPAGGMTLWSLGPELLALRETVEGFDAQRLVLLYSSLPRLVTSLLAGAALGVAGVILQQVLRNPLASPTTLGLSAGAKLSLSLATLYAPGLFVLGHDIVALAGSLAAGLVVLALGARRDFSPVTLVLAGLVVSLYCGALSALLVLLNDRYLESLFIWGGGSLQQQDWSVPLTMLPRLLVLGVVVALLVRPLELLSLPDDQARALGLRTATIRWGGAAVALCLTAVVTSLVGVIGFIGLLAPTVARLCGARRFRQRLVWAALLGAALLWLTDQAVQVAAGSLADFLPTGAVTALFGTPLLLLLLPRLCGQDRPPSLSPRAIAPRQARTTFVLLVLLALLIVLCLLAVVAGRLPDGSWGVLPGALFGDILPWRLPRMLAALAAGLMLAGAGLILQRLTANEMASPEVLGVSAGATMGMAALIFLVASPALPMQMGSAALGALAVLLLILMLGWRSGFAPERVILAGIALNALLDAVVALLSATGDPRAFQLLNWIAGSTYGVILETALPALAAALLLLGLCCLGLRWLDVLPLGRAAAQAVGIAVRRARILLFTQAVLLTAAGTMIVGPLSFVGLMAPHIARELGLLRARSQLPGALLAGAAVMVLADWIGRNLVFPYQLPAGLVSALVGAPFLMLLLRRKR